MEPDYSDLEIHAAMKNIGNLTLLSNDREKWKLLSSLPVWLVTFWGRIDTKHTKDTNAFSPFKKYGLHCKGC